MDSDQKKEENNVPTSKNSQPNLNNLIEEIEPETITGDVGGNSVSEIITDDSQANNDENEIITDDTVANTESEVINVEDSEPQIKQTKKHVEDGANNVSEIFFTPD